METGTVSTSFSLIKSLFPSNCKLSLKVRGGFLGGSSLVFCSIANSSLAAKALSTGFIPFGKNDGRLCR